MWPWQRNGEQPNHTLIRRLVGLSSLGHAVLLVCLFVFYHDDATKVSRDVIAVLLDADVTVVKVPLAKVMNKKAPVIGSPAKAAAKAPAVKEAPPATAIIAKPKVQPKVAAKAKKEKSKPKPAAKAKKEAPKPKEPPKVEPKKIEEKKPAPKVEEIPKKPEPIVAAKPDASAIEAHAEVGENVVYLGQHEYEALEVQRQIQQEAQRCWKAPPGVAEDVMCQIVVHIDRNGAIQDIAVAEQSGILMFDVHARQAVSRMEFPRGSWGKEVVVYFK